MEANGHDRKFTVCALEFVGTALFIFGLISTTLPLSIPFSLFASVVIFGDITGGHFNPAVTLGVFTQLGDYGKNFLFMIIIMLSQFLGGFAAVGLAWLGAFTIPDAKIAMLGPTNPVTGMMDNGADMDDFSMYIAVLTNEIVGTFLFVSVILMVKGKDTAGDRGGVYAAICVVTTLLCVISGTKELGACFNPAVGVSVTTYSVARITPELPEGFTNNFLYAYVWCYMIGPWCGGLLAGLFHIWHRTSHESAEHHGSPRTTPHGMPAETNEGLLHNKDYD